MSGKEYTKKEIAVIIFIGTFIGNLLYAALSGIVKGLISVLN